MKFIYPPIKNLSPSPNTKNVTFEDILNDSNFSNDLGSFIIGKNKVFHGGINLVVPTGHGLQAVADGRIVAYRVTKNNQKIYSAHNIDGTITPALEFSNNFVLVEHNFDKFEYTKFVTGGSFENPYKGYKFYALYMHMMPLDECAQFPLLPDWLVLNKSKNSNAILRGEILSPNVLSFTKGFTIADVTSSSNKIKISQNDIVNINQKNYLNKKLEWYDSSTDPIKILDKYLNNEDVVLLDDNTAIPVKAGELLGYAGSSQANGIDQSQVNFMHFEIWLDKIDFLNNINNKDASYIPNNDRNLSTQKSALFNNLNKRSLGLSYLNNASKSIFESFTFQADVNSPSGLNVVTRLEKNLSSIPVTVASTAFLSSTLNNSVHTFYTDADWLNNPVNQWKVYRQSDFFNSDGSIKETDYKDKYSNPLIWRKLQNRAIIKLKYSEWDKKYFEKKFKFLLEKQNTYYSKLDKMTFDTLKKYQDSVSFLDKTASSTLIPKINKIHVVNPIEFLMQMKRCMLPGPPSANTHLVKRLLQYSLDESVFLLSALIEKMGLWVSGGTDPDLDVKFKMWFGYSRVVAPPTPAPNSPPIPAPTPPPTPTSVTYIRTTTPPNVTDFNVASEIVLTHLKFALKVLKSINYERLCFGWGLDAGAFVFPGDSNHNVHIGLQVFPLSAVDVSGKVNTIENFAIPTFRRATTGQLGLISSIVHETLHFAIKNSDITNQALVSSMYPLANSTDYRYLNDIKVDYFIGTRKYEFRGYGLAECKDLARYLSSATLCNSDNYAEFFAEVMQGLRPTLQYKGI